MDNNFTTIINTAIEHLSKVTTEDEKWDLANKIIRQLGGNALNVVISTGTHSIKWARGSMSESWAADYLAEGFPEVDPIFTNMHVANKFTSFDAGEFTPNNTENKKLIEFSQGFVGTGHNSIFGKNFNDDINNDRKTIIITSEYSSEDFNKILPRHQLVHLMTILAAYFTVPKDPDHAGVFVVGEKRLTEKEIEILSWLATGLQNAAIAEKMNVAEVTIRKHFVNIRIKLRAQTREQSLAIAIRDGHLTF